MILSPRRLSSRTGLAGTGAALALLALGGCQAGTDRLHALAPTVRRGAVLIQQAQCGACHQIPGIFGANGMVGPPLGGFARRTMVAGLLPNTPDNLALWLRRPQSVTPGNAMPDMGLSEAQARDVAAYLRTLR